MIKLKKAALVLLCSFILMFLFSSAVYAQTPTPRYIYYQGAGGHVYMVNYEEAKDLAIGGNDALYRKAADGIEKALANFWGVWIEVEIDGEWRVIDYSKVIEDNMTYAEIVAEIRDGGDGDAYVLTDAPEAIAEYYFDEVTGKVENRNPVIEVRDHPEWFDKDSFKPVFEELSKTWVVDIVLTDAGDLQGKLNQINQVDLTVEIDGVNYQKKELVRRPGTNTWRAVFSKPGGFDDEPEPILDFGGVRVRIAGTWYE